MNARGGRHVDGQFITVAFLLAVMGLVMVTSSSIAIAEASRNDPFYYFWRHIEYLVLACIAGALFYRVSMQQWLKASPWMLIISAALLLLVLFVGHKVNGSTRWLCLAGQCFQVSELAKFSLVMYMAGFLARHEDLKQSVWIFLTPAIVLGILGGLLIWEPDFGAFFVMVCTVAAMLYVSGVNRMRFILVAAVTLGLLTLLVVWSGYRSDRLLAMFDPCGAYKYEAGYQLCQALIAFGQGGFFGVGLGSSVQKLFYLPEAHTDFVFAVLGEELGFIGVVFVIALYYVLILRICKLARKAESRKKLFAAYVAYGLGFWITVQALVSMGVNTGLLPTKGLTMPLMSYGGSSLFVTVVALAVLLRIGTDSERRGGSS